MHQRQTFLCTALLSLKPLFLCTLAIQKEQSISQGPMLTNIKQSSGPANMHDSLAKKNIGEAFPLRVSISVV